MRKGTYVMGIHGNNNEYDNKKAEFISQCVGDIICSIFPEKNARELFDGYGITYLKNIFRPIFTVWAEQGTLEDNVNARSWIEFDTTEEDLQKDKLSLKLYLRVSDQIEYHIVNMQILS